MGNKKSVRSMNRILKEVVIFSMVGMMLHINVYAKEVGNVTLSNDSIYPISQGISNSDKTYNDYLKSLFGEDTEEEKNNPIEEKPEEELNDADKSVIQYFKEALEELKSYYQSEDFKKLRKRGQEIVVQGIDFLFYNGKINEFTLEQLTEEGKKDVANTIEGTIDFLNDVCPGLVDGLEEKYIVARDFLKEKSNSALESFKEWVGEEKYNQLIESAQDIGDGLKKVLSIFGKIADEKYQEFKNK